MGINNFTLSRLTIRTPTLTYGYLQFGGTGDDTLYDVKVNADGDFVVLGKTTSPSLDGNANPNAASFFIARIDKNLPRTGFIKEIVWEDAGSNKTIGKSSRGHEIYINGDYVYYLYGVGTETDVADTDGWVVRRREIASLSTVLDSSSFSNRFGTGFIRSGGYFIYNHDQKAKIRRFDLSTLALGTAAGGINNYQHTGDATYVPTSGGFWNIFILINGGYAGEQWGTSFSTVPAYQGYSNSHMAQSLGYRVHKSCTNNTTLFVCGKYSNADLRVKLSRWNWFNADDASTLITGSETSFFTPQFIGSELVLSGYSGKTGVIGTRDLYIERRDPANLTTVNFSDWMKYSNGDRIGQASKSYWMNNELTQYDTGKYVICGYTDGNLNGFANAGGTSDCFLMKITSSGVMIPDA